MYNDIKKNALTFLFIIFCLLFITNNVNAAECSNSEYKELKELAKQVQLKYENDDPEKTSERIGFNVYIYNLNKKLYMDAGQWSEIYFYKNPQQLGAYKSGDKIKTTIYASSKTNCVDLKLATITLQLPYFNEYSILEECKGKNIDICKKWSDTSNITKEEFLKLINKKNKIEKNSLLTNILNFIKKYIVFIIIGIVLLASTVTIVIIRNKKNKKIEI